MMTDFGHHTEVREMKKNNNKTRVCFKGGGQAHIGQKSEHTAHSAALMAETITDWLVFSCSTEEAGTEVDKTYPLELKMGGE
jgi:hypothetical protein